MTEEHPSVEARLAAAEQIVAGEDGYWRDGGEDVTGKFGLREGEEDDGDESPENKEFGEGVAGAIGSGTAQTGSSQAPLSNGSENAVNQCANGDDRPGHHCQYNNDKVVPEGLGMLIAVGGEALQVVLEEELTEEAGIIPRK